MNPICKYCGRESNLVRSNAVYPHLPNLYEKYFYLCGCGAFVGCHPGTTRPLGILANAELRRLKSHVHRIFDPQWKRKRMSRGDAYRKLQQEMNILGIECHIGMFDEERCKKAIKILSKW